MVICLMTTSFHLCTIPLLCRKRTLRSMPEAIAAMLTVLGAAASCRHLYRLLQEQGRTAEQLSVHVAVVSSCAGPCDCQAELPCTESLRAGRASHVMSIE
jgi:hypothetical protein